MIAVGGIVTLLILAIGPSGRQANSSPANSKPAIRIAYFPNLTHAPAIVGFSRGLFASALPEFRVEPKLMIAGPEVIEALFAGEVDAAYIGPCPATNAFAISEGHALRVIAGACEGGISFVAAPGVPVHSVGDLANRSIAVPQLGGTQDVSCRHFIHAAGLRTQDEGGTVRVLAISKGDLLASFKRGEVDAAWVPEPWVSRLVHEAGGKIVADEQSLWPDHRCTSTVLIVRTAFAQDHPDVVPRIVQANADAIDWINGSSEAHSSVNHDIARLTGAELSSQEAADAWSRLSFTSSIDRDGIRSLANALVECRYLSAMPSRLDDMFGLAGQGPARQAR